MSQLLDAISAQMERAVVEGQAAFDAARKGNPDDLIRLYVSVSESYDRLDAARKQFNAMIESISRNVIPEVMQERQIRTITLDDIKKRVTVSTRITASIVPEAKSEAYEWLRAPAQDAGALIQETVNAGTLSSYAKQLLEDKGMELPATLFRMNSMQYTSVTKVK